MPLTPVLGELHERRGIQGDCESQNQSMWDTDAGLPVWDSVLVVDRQMGQDISSRVRGSSGTTMP
jgi:hypothetical protein